MNNIETIRKRHQKACGMLEYRIDYKDVERLFDELDKHRWRKVEDDGLPELGERVEAYDKNGTWYPYAGLHLCCQKRVWCYLNTPDHGASLYIENDVTHWKPMTPPEETP